MLSVNGRSVIPPDMKSCDAPAFRRRTSARAYIYKMGLLPSSIFYGPNGDARGLEIWRAKAMEILDHVFSARARRENVSLCLAPGARP